MPRMAGLRKVMGRERQAGSRRNHSIGYAPEPVKPQDSLEGCPPRFCGAERAADNATSGPPLPQHELIKARCCCRKFLEAGLTCRTMTPVQLPRLQDVVQIRAARHAWRMNDRAESQRHRWRRFRVPS